MSGMFRAIGLPPSWGAALFGAPDSSADDQASQDDPTPTDPDTLTTQQIGPEPPRNRDLGALQPDFADKIRSFMSASQSERGVRLIFLEGFRSKDRQAWLYARYQNGGPKAAPPGGRYAYHEIGRAADLWPANQDDPQATITLKSLIDLGARLGLKSLPGISDFDHWEDA